MTACHPAVKSTLPSAPNAAQLAELWSQPDRARDLYWGVGGNRLAPNPTARYTVIEIKQSGFSRGYTVADSDGHHWSAKFPPEASTEVVASRLHWGIGYHQPPVYLLTDWTADKATTPNPQLARALPRKQAGSSRPRRQGHLVLLPQSLRRHAAAPGACWCSRRCSATRT